MGTIPQNYIALVGDSYAQGYGDWFLNSNFNENPPFHSAHVINQKTAVDVISFGVGGADNVRGLTTLPISSYQYINAQYLLEMAAPQTILVYFYEGNDLSDNLSGIERFYRNNFEMERIYDPGYLRTFIDYRINKEHPLNRMESAMRVKDQLLFATFFKKLIRSFFGEKTKQKRTSREAQNEIINRIKVNDTDVEIPGKLQSLALELSDAEIALSIYIFEQSLKYLCDYFENARVGIVYIPAPLSCYEITSPQVIVQALSGREMIYDSEQVRKRSDDISQRIKSIAKQQQVSFVDARKYIRPVAKEEILHGPRDWKHFNQKGYTLLAEAAVALLNQMK